MPPLSAASTGSRRPWLDDADAEGFLADRRLDEDIAAGEPAGQVGVRHAAGETHAAGDAEAFGEPLQRRLFRSFADDEVVHVGRQSRQRLVDHMQAFPADDAADADDDARVGRQAGRAGVGACG
jgi:hypothetical protein